MEIQMHYVHIIALLNDLGTLMECGGDIFKFVDPKPPKQQ